MNASLAPPAPRTAADLFAPVAADLDAAERLLSRTVSSSAPGVQRLVAHLSHYRGKRLRPTLLLLTARACGRVVPAHHTLAAVVEMIHTATLVHDDVLDGATLRRHVATVNSGWGTQASILLGDYLFTHAFHLASSVDARACRLIGAATNRLCAGELHQVVERGNLHLDEEAYFAIIDGKTASTAAPTRRRSNVSRASAVPWAWRSRSRMICWTWSARNGPPANRWAPTWSSRS
jgi:octaprenyl-diphosphate synthase